MAVPPHEVAGDELPASLERVEQGERTVRSGQRQAGVYLDHRQPAPGRGDGVALPGVRLLPDPQRANLCLEGGAIGHGGQRGSAAAGWGIPPDGLPSLLWAFFWRARLLRASN